jgi:hypothetical protein
MTNDLNLVIAGVLLLNLDGSKKALKGSCGKGFSAVAAVTSAVIATYLTAVGRNLGDGCALQPAHLLPPRVGVGVGRSCCSCCYHSAAVAVG